MLNVTLHENDSLETVLPAVELAMQTGDVCRINNINYLGRAHMAALCLLATSENLMDLDTGRVFHAHPGFGLLGLDQDGEIRTLLM